MNTFNQSPFGGGYAENQTRYYRCGVNLYLNNRKHDAYVKPRSPKIIHGGIHDSSIFGEFLEDPTAVDCGAEQQYFYSIMSKKNLTDDYNIDRSGDLINTRSKQLPSNYYIPSDEVVCGFLGEIALFDAEITSHKDHGPLQALSDWLHPRTLAAWEEFVKRYPHEISIENVKHLKNEAKEFISKQLYDLFSLWAGVVRESDKTAVFHITSNQNFRPAVRRGIENWIPMSEEKVSLFFYELKHELNLLAEKGRSVCDWFSLNIQNKELVILVSPLPWKATKKKTRKNIVLD